MTEQRMHREPNDEGGFEPLDETPVDEAAFAAPLDEGVLTPDEVVLTPDEVAPAAEEPPPLPDAIAAEPDRGTAFEQLPPADAQAEAQPGAVDAASLVPLTDLAPAITTASVTRRAFLGFGVAIAGGLVGATALARFFPVFADSSAAPSPVVSTYDPASKAWTFVVDTSACIGCGLCVSACKEENHVPKEPSFTRTWVERHTRTADDVLYVDSPEGGVHGFPPDSVAPGAEGKPVKEAFFEPRLCMQCANSPCTKVCPVGATYRTADGVILVDARRCIGCGYCVVACPYGARYIVPAGGDAPNDTPGIADKCTWCYHRISRGSLPACVEVCPVGARKFGDRNDPDSEITAIVRDRQPQMLHPEYGTEPRVLYLGPAITEA